MNPKQVWKRLLFAFGGLLLVWLLVALFFDIGPVDDSDFALPERKVDPARNPFPELRDLAFSDEEMEALWQCTIMLVGRGTMNEALLEDLLERHAPALERFARYAAMTQWKDSKTSFADTEGEYLFPWSNLSDLRKAEAALLASNGKPEEAVECALSLFRFANGLKSAEVPLLHGMYANAIANDGCFALVGLIENGLPPSSLEKLAQRLDELADVDDHFDTVMRAEYLFFKKPSLELFGPSSEVKPISPSSASASLSSAIASIGGTGRPILPNLPLPTSKQFQLIRWTESSCDTTRRATSSTVSVRTTLTTAATFTQHIPSVTGRKSSSTSNRPRRCLGRISKSGRRRRSDE